MNKNRIEGDAEQGERANSREALVIEARRRRSGDRAGTEHGCCKCGRMYFMAGLSAATYEQFCILRDKRCREKV
ncbi:hypothetical protein EU555_23170 [Methylobacterium nonmethylotrophicum]|uniref:Uncharacterized protein n=1 Tax=Methylobacterium nonmethylotrophicum TaxID=1141884 RepID=A0A4Z0NLG1_9HYPH|nr:hypothetical protein EU555_23170 [Methylobacterium nonmethylotrophicum]